MKLHNSILAATVAIAALATPALAQDMTNTATSESLSQSGVHNEGDRVNNRSGSAVAPSANSTAPCVVGQSFGIAVAGTGLAAGGGHINDECVTREEALILSKIANMRGAQRQVTIYHFCRNDRTMRNTMIAMGWCSVQR